ncbi:MAG: hypothetical protein JO117_02385 [Verrucomicrobia bacterium]|nr:hypothetical protein [Verrucomicrobiota bacterium]MBV9659166.1 hypothetical protein [Verrucomicrobiota bacterium]
MPLHLNLFHEQQKQLAERKRDPLKLGFYAMGALTALFVIFYLVKFGTSASLNNQLSAKRAEFAKKYEVPLKNADIREKELAHTTTAANALTARIDGRFYWAPLLEVLGHTTPREVQIVSFNGNSEPKEKMVNFTLEGVAADRGRGPRDTAEQFRVALGNNLNEKYGAGAATVRFRSGALDETMATVTLDGQTKATAKFTIEIALRKQPSATPAPAITTTR